jgi:DNA-binding NtrC family response regulator
MVMVLDDQELMRDSLREVLSRAGYRVRAFGEPAENEFLRGELRDGWSPEEIVGREGGLRQLWAQVQKTAKTTATVLIRGETGVGKELVARAIHYGSDRAARPFVRVNCAALSAGLLESELFGHVKGAFTGATADRAGRFELADGGSLLLDEISEMGLDLQGKLLRALQERESERVGASEPRKFDVRVMATSNRDLEKSMAAGRFRQDLYFRLNVVPLAVPPLRERKEDIPLLAEHFLGRLNIRVGARFMSVADDALAMLVAYDWPGNVRELANVLERAAVLGSGSELRREHLDVNLAGQRMDDLTAAAETGIKSVAQAEREAILAAYRHYAGQRRDMARALGISERTLREKLRLLKEEGVIA